ncbi:hypothetical protein JIN85_16620 [Luteolibacter pohnpeiensis]|uniref:Uncharacterized protein n=1 Tax=Luteolibacter pohnpeiensis TaxID=454153 RepID=A0A934VX72_9BACT|nr:hypothetical protein [Luteolibacter pohnpeiensis]MBK1884045.1 hypothetical protein [Luteolibacter pohnpeiensis]
MNLHILIGALFGAVLGIAIGKVSGGNPDAAAKHMIERSEKTKISNRTRTVREDKLVDVQACRDAIAASAIPDGRHPLLRKMDRERALRRWLELDSSSALAEAESNQDDSFAIDLFKQWVELDPISAVEGLGKLNPSLADKLSRDFFITLMGRDPVLAAQEFRKDRWQLGQKSLSDRLEFNRVISLAWFNADPDAAIASLDGVDLRVRDADNLTEGSILIGWGKVDFDAAWTYLTEKTGSIDDSLTSPGGMDLLAEGLLCGKSEAIAVLASLSDLDGRDMRNRVSQLADTMVRVDMQESLDWALEQPEDDPIRKNILRYVASKMAAADPDRALEMLDESKGTGARYVIEGITRESFAALASSDPVASAERILDLPVGQRKAAMGGWLTRVFASDPDAALAQCRNWMEDPELSADLPAAWALSFSWEHGSGVRDPGEMLAAMPELNDAVNGMVLSTWAKSDPESAANWVTERLELGEKVPFNDGPFIDDSFLMDLSISRPEFTANWVMGLPDGEIQREAARTLISNWAAFDPDAANNWINSLPPGPVRGAAEEGLSKTTKQNQSPF